jgi:hypothetical protein
MQFSNALAKNAFGSNLRKGFCCSSSRTLMAAAAAAAADPSNQSAATLSQAPSTSKKTFALWIFSVDSSFSISFSSLLLPRSSSGGGSNDGATLKGGRKKGQRRLYKHLLCSFCCAMRRRRNELARQTEEKAVSWKSQLIAIALPLMLPIFFKTLRFSVCSCLGPHRPWTIDLVFTGRNTIRNIAKTLKRRNINLDGTATFHFPFIFKTPHSTPIKSSLLFSPQASASTHL